MAVPSVGAPLQVGEERSGLLAGPQTDRREVVEVVDPLDVDVVEQDHRGAALGLHLFDGVELVGVVAGNDLALHLRGVEGAPVAGGVAVRRRLTGVDQ